MIAVLNSAVAAVETQLSSDPSVPVDVSALARQLGTTEHHLRRMFSSLAAMPLSEYVRRRLMSLAAADLVTGDDDLLTSRSGTATARPRRSVGRSAPSTAPGRRTYAATVARYAPNRRSGST